MTSLMARTLWASVLAACLVVAPARADEAEARLDQLFERLQADDDADASVAEALIWDIWLTYPGGDPEVARLMRDGRVAMLRRDWPAAELAFDGVVERDPSYAEGWNRRATVRYLRGDYVASVADIQAVLALEPRHFGALSGLGLCYTELGELERAIAAFEAALKINPHLPGARENIILLRERMAGAPI